ncbi:hypothetical protein Tco_1469759, partial [Tanacetum coccineum]
HDSLTCKPWMQDLELSCPRACFSAQSQHFSFSSAETRVAKSGFVVLCGSGGGGGSVFVVVVVAMIGFGT